MTEVVFREMSDGLMVFDRNGFLTLSNPAARALLNVDLQSRRRYLDIFGNESSLIHPVREVLESGKRCASETWQFSNSAGEPQRVKVSVAP